MGEQRMGAEHPARRFRASRGTTAQSGIRPGWILDGWIDGCFDGWIDGWIQDGFRMDSGIQDGLMDSGWIDGWIRLAFVLLQSNYI